MLDNGWDTAPDFAERIAAAETAIAEAERDGRPVSFVATAEPRAESLAAGDRRRRQATARGDRAAALPSRPRRRWPTRLDEAFGERSVEVALGRRRARRRRRRGVRRRARTASPRAAACCSRRGPLTVLRPPENRRGRRARAGRAASAARGEVGVAGFDQEGRRILEGAATLDSDGAGAAEIALPAEIRNSLDPLSRRRRGERRRGAAARRHAGSGSRSASSPAKAPTPRSRCSSRSPMSSGRSRRPPTCFRSERAEHQRGGDRR